MENDVLASPFHKGEQYIQDKIGVRDRMEQFGQRVIRDYLPQQHREFYQQLPFVFAGHQDAQGQVWASILCGDAGFISTLDERTMRMKTTPLLGDPLKHSLDTGLQLGFLGIELATRRRNRFSATLSHANAQSIELDIVQTFGNCPQYITPRNVKARAEQPRVSIVELTRFDDEVESLIGQADTFFVASHSGNAIEGHASGADISHRGGKQGFVQVDDDITLTIPDYRGNNHFNTLGNFYVNSAAGLLFIDFIQGDVISLTGHAEILWHTPDTEHFEGAARAWRFTLSRLVKMKGVLPFVFDV